MNDSEYHQLMLERQQRLEEAIIAAEHGYGTHEDWAIICAECGVPPLNVIKGKHNVSHSERRI